MALATFDPSARVLVATGVLVAAGAAGARLPAGGRTGTVMRRLEAATWAGCVIVTGTGASPLLPYLLAPALVAGLVEGTRRGLIVPAVGAATLLGGAVAGDVSLPLGAPAADIAQWLALAAAGAAAGGWVRRQQTVHRPEGPQAAQEAAHRLLVQLRVVSRRLPGTLSPAATAETLLSALRGAMPVDRGAVLVTSGGQRLGPLAYLGDSTLDWQLELHADTAVAEAWAAQVPVVKDAQFPRARGPAPPGSALAVPLSLGGRTFGIVALETAVTGAYDAAAVRTATQRAEQVALPLDTGLLFDEIRGVATAEERKRVAREIHDGIAQELVYLGYAMDNAMAQTDEPHVQASLQELRSEIGRIVGELRMSLFDLRSAVDPQAGLGAALSEHVRTVGARSGLTVHLSLTESTLRLPPETEAELLRIAQEAVANARKHAAASNLWVSFVVDPPSATLVIEDDGTGLPAEPGGDDSYGFRIMRERAARIRADLSVGARPGGPGTCVRVRLSGVTTGRPG